ncbi:MAG: hypothetical protein J6C52_07765 [Clostridia bacterium]|nr:hypothetical protein [Clostridia bacterium]
MPQIKFDQPWWIGDLQEAAAIGDKLYICTGNIDPGFYNRIYALVFNKELAKTSGAGDFYALVRNGKWTFDALQSAAKTATVDINGDSQMDDKDQYGLILNSYMSVDSFNNAFDIKFVENDKDGLPTLLPLSEHFTDAATALREFARRSGNVHYVTESDLPGPQYTMFEEGRGLMLTSSLGNLQKMRGFELDFGILPYPKWDEAQKDYISYAATDPVAGYCVPVTADAELAGCLLEALAYYGWEDVYPEYYERALKGKNTRDDESAEMLDLIFDNLRFGFIQTYTHGIGEGNSPSMMLRNTIQNDIDIASEWAAKEELNKQKIQEFIDALK